MARTTPRVERGVLLLPTSRDSTVSVGSQQWFSWLSDEKNSSFFFSNEAGSFTARKERRKRGGWYWIAYRSRGGRLAKTYIGRSEDLTAKRLSEVTLLFAEQGTDANQRPFSAHPILTTKFAPPSLTRRTTRLLERPQLLERLNECLQVNLMLVTAPAGFGKTTLLSTWYEMRRAQWQKRPDEQTPALAWISLDEQDNEPLRFWSGLWSVFSHEQRRGAGVDIAPPLYSTPQMPIETVLATLVSSFGKSTRPFVLIFDDYSNIRSPQIHEGMAFLLAHLPSHVHLILAGRSQPPLPLGRLRMYGEMTELHVEDLRLSNDETEHFLNKCVEVVLSTAVREALQKRTEGWIAGLYLVAMALRDQQRPEDVLERFSGSQRSLFDYFAEEVLQQQPEEIQHFLLSTAPLNELTPQLCAAMLGGEEHEGDEVRARWLLETIEHANLFLIPLDERRQRYRYHTLFREFLYERLRQKQPEREPDLHRRAADWYEQQEMIEEAIEHALAAQDNVKAQRLIERIGEEVLWKKGEAGRLLTWLRALPSSYINGCVQLEMLHAWALLLTGSLERSEELLDRIASSVENREGSLRGEIAALRARIAAFRDDKALVIELSRRALQELPGERSLLRADVAFGLGGTGDLDEAYRMLAEALHISQALSSLRTMLFASRYLALICLQQGRLTEAKAILQQALFSTDTKGKRQVSASGIIHVGLAELFYERNELNEALRHARLGVELGEHSGEIKAVLSGYCILASIYAAQEKYEQAQQALWQSEAIARMGNVPWLREQMVAIAVQLALLQGDIKGAVRAARNIGIDPEEGSEKVSCPGQENECLLLTRIWLTQERFSQAAELLEAVISNAQRAKHVRMVLQASTQLAIALAGMGQQRQATQVISEALLLAEPEGYVRVFLDMGDPLQTLLQRVVGRAESYARKLLSMIEGADRKTDSPLSEREHEILQLLARGMSNQEIAEELFIAASTVKAHVTHIYQKLGVQKRLQAVALAREKGFLS